MNTTKTACDLPGVPDSTPVVESVTTLAQALWRAACTNDLNDDCLDLLLRFRDDPRPQILHAVQLVAATQRWRLDPARSGRLARVLDSDRTGNLAPEVVVKELDELADQLYQDSAPDADSIRKLATAVRVLCGQATPPSPDEVEEVANGIGLLDGAAFAAAAALLSAAGNGSAELRRALLERAPGRERPEWTAAKKASEFAVELHGLLAAELAPQRRGWSRRGVAIVAGIAALVLLSIALIVAMIISSDPVPTGSAVEAAVEVTQRGPEPAALENPLLPGGLAEGPTVLICEFESPELRAHVRHQVNRGMIGDRQRAMPFVDFSSLELSELIPERLMFNNRTHFVLGYAARAGLLPGVRFVLTVREVDVIDEGHRAAVVVDLVELPNAEPAKERMPVAAVWSGVWSFELRHAVEAPRASRAALDWHAIGGLATAWRPTIAELLIAQPEPPAQYYEVAACLLIGEEGASAGAARRAREILRVGYDKHRTPRTVRLRMVLEDEATARRLGEMHEGVGDYAKLLLNGKNREQVQGELSQKLVLEILGPSHRNG